MKKDLLNYAYGKIYEKLKGFIRKSLCLDEIVNIRIRDNSSLVIFVEKNDKKKKECPPSFFGNIIISIVGYRIPIYACFR